MKIRTDFVTNSSSSSFVCYGVSKSDIPVTDEQKFQAWQEQVDYVKEQLDAKNFSRWCTEEYYTKKYNELLAMDAEEKLDYGDRAISDGDDFYDTDLITVGGQERDEVGITVSTLESKFPELRLSEVRQFVAVKLNERFGTSFTKKDICYFESGWYDG